MATMNEISIGDNHREYLARLEHIGAHVQTEAARLHAELRYVREQGQRIEAELRDFLLRAYDLDLARSPGVTLDTARGVLIVPDDDPPAVPTPAPTPASE